MNKYKVYTEILKESKQAKFYWIVLNDINIDVNVIIESLKNEFGMSTWFKYSSHNSVTLGYFISSNDSYENIMKIKKFLHEHLIYFRDMDCYDDDRRIVLKFVDPGDPVKFKFHN